MTESMAVTAEQTLILFALMGFGAAARFTGIFDASAVKRITDFVLMIVTPCLIISAFRREYDPGALAGAGWALALAVFTHAASIALARVAVRDRDERRRRALRFATVFSNAGFMGLPLEQAVLGAEGVFYGSIYVVVFQIMCWTYGIWEIGGAKGMSLKTVVNPGTIGVALGLPLFLFSMSPPPVVARPVEIVGDLNTPLSMLVMGFHLGGARFRSALSSLAAYAAMGVRHFAVPAATCAAAAALCAAGAAGAGRTVALAAVIPAAAPFGASVAMFSAKYGGDGEFASAAVAVSTIFSIFTLPLAVGAADAVLGAI